MKQSSTSPFDLSHSSFVLPDFKPSDKYPPTCITWELSKFSTNNFCSHNSDKKKVPRKNGQGFIALTFWYNIDI